MQLQAGPYLWTTETSTAPHAAAQPFSCAVLPVQQLPGACGILNNGCCRTWCLSTQADTQFRMTWPGFAVLLQNQVDLCKALVQEASTQFERGQVMRALVFSHEDFEQSAISEITRQIIQHIPTCAFKRYINQISHLQQIFAAGVANPNGQNSTHHDVLDHLRNNKTSQY
jgi:hypothetical protein